MYAESMVDEKYICFGVKTVRNIHNIVPVFSKGVEGSASLYRNLYITETKNKQTKIFYKNKEIGT